MPTGHLMRGLLGGIVAALIALVLGQPLWMAALLYMGVGNAILLTGMLLDLMAGRRRPPSRRRAPERRKVLRPLPH
jgi:hypothetical protein